MWSTIVGYMVTSPGLLKPCMSERWFMNGWLKLVYLSDGQSTVVGWSDGNSAHSAKMIYAERVRSFVQPVPGGKAIAQSQM